MLQGIQAFIQGIKMEPFISCSKIAKPSFDTFSSKQLSSTKILNWQALDQIGHFAWGIGNKRCRASCVLDVSSDTYDTLRMICGDEVCFHSLFFWAFYCWSFISKTTVHNFSAAGDLSLHWGNQYSVRAGCVCLFWQIRKHQHGLIHACLGAGGQFNCKASPNWHSSKNQYTIHCCRESKHSSKESKWSRSFLAQKSQNLVSTHSAQNNSLQQKFSIGKRSIKSVISPGASGTRGAGPRAFSTSPVTHTTLWEWFVEMRYVFILCFSELFIVEVLSRKQQFTIFLLQGIQAYIEGTSTQSVLDVFVFWQIRKHQHALIHACFRACGHFNCKASLNWHSRKNNSLFIAAGNPSIHPRNQNGALHSLLKNRKT